MFTGFRLSLGIAWLVIVAAEMLTGAPGVGGFLWQEYNSLIYEHIILCILTIGLVGFVARPPDERASKRALQAALTSWRSSNSTDVSKGYGATAAHRRAARRQPARSSAASSSPIVGYSGAGKTTLISLLAGLLTPDRGTVVLDGQADHRARPRARRRVPELLAAALADRASRTCTWPSTRCFPSWSPEQQARRTPRSTSRW